MNENVILETYRLSKKFKNTYGVKDITFDVYKNEVFGIIGENGAGKSTVVRLLMGFLKPTQGKGKICGLNTYLESKEVKEHVSYIPGEFTLLDLKTGKEFLDYMKEVNGGDDEVANELIKMFQLDIRAYPKRMSKGMKQKMAIVACFMKQADIYILDEPTIGLDPLMRETFMELILDYKNKGKTILMCTNNYEEVTRLCDRCLILSKGEIIDLVNIKELKDGNYVNVEFSMSDEDFDNLKRYKKLKFDRNGKNIETTIKSSHLGYLYSVLSSFKVSDFSVKDFDLEDYATRKMEESINEK